MESARTDDPRITGEGAGVETGAKAITSDSGNTAPPKRMAAAIAKIANSH